MKKLFAALILSVGLTPAWAEWVRLSRSESHILHLDISSIVNSANSVRGWVMFDRVQGSNDRVVSALSFFEADCKSGQLRELQSIEYSGQMGGGNVLKSFNTPTELSYPPPGTLNANIFRVLCTR